MAKTAARDPKAVAAKHAQLDKQRELAAECRLRGHVYMKVHRKTKNRCSKCKRRR